LVADHNGDWCVGLLSEPTGEQKEESVLVHFIGWKEEHDECVRLMDGRIRPLFLTLSAHGDFHSNLSEGDYVDLQCMDEDIDHGCVWIQAIVMNRTTFVVDGNIRKEITVRRTLLGPVYSDRIIPEAEWMRNILPPHTASSLQRFHADNELD